MFGRRSTAPCHESLSSHTVLQCMTCAFEIGSDVLPCPARVMSFRTEFVAVSILTGMLMMSCDLRQHPTREELSRQNSELRREIVPERANELLAVFILNDKRSVT